MIAWTPTVFECLICMRFLFLYLHLFSAIEHVLHGKALKKYAHYYHQVWYQGGVQISLHCVWYQGDIHISSGMVLGCNSQMFIQVSSLY